MSLLLDSTLTPWSQVYPPPGMRETFSMITAIHLGSREGMEAFCKAVQKMSPVGSYIEPVPGGCGRGRLEIRVWDPTFSLCQVGVGGSLGTRVWGHFKDVLGWHVRRLGHA